MIRLKQQLILLLTLCFFAACSLFKPPSRDLASLPASSYQDTLLFPDSETLTQKIFPDYAKLHYDLTDKEGQYLGKIEFKRDRKLHIKALSPLKLPYLANTKNSWSGLSFAASELDYLQRTKFYWALQLGPKHQITLRALKRQALEMVIKSRGKQHTYYLTRPQAYPLD